MASFECSENECEVAKDKLHASDTHHPHPFELFIRRWHWSLNGVLLVGLDGENLRASTVDIRSCHIDSHSLSWIFQTAFDLHLILYVGVLLEELLHPRPPAIVPTRNLAPCL